MLRAGEAVLGLGVPLDKALDIVERLTKNADRVSETFVRDLLRAGLEAVRRGRPAGGRLGGGARDARALAPARQRRLRRDPAAAHGARRRARVRAGAGAPRQTLTPASSIISPVRAFTAGHKSPVECDRRGHRPWSATAGHTSKGLSSTCHRPSSSTPSVRPSGAPSRARSPRCARMRRSRSSSTSSSSATPGSTRRASRRSSPAAGCPQGLQANNIGRIAVLLSEKLGAGDERDHRLALLRVRPRRDPRRGEQRRRRPGGRLHRLRRRVRQPLQRRAGGCSPGGSERAAPGQGARPARRIHRDGPDGGERRRQVGRHA